MDRIYQDLDRLIAILEAEAEGGTVDLQAAHELIGRLGPSCPGITQTLGRIGARLHSRNHPAAA